MVGHGRRKTGGEDPARIKKGRKTRQGLDKAVVIYDGDCPVCQEAVAWMEARGKKNAFEMLPCQTVERRSRYPYIPETVCMEAMQLVLPTGEVLSGEAAFPEIFKRSKGFSFLPSLLSLPGFSAVLGLFYRWFARNRYPIAALLKSAPDDKKRR